MGADLIGRSHGRPWRKVLYEAQPFGDQYTSRGFLQALVVNATVPQRRYARVAWAATAVDQEVSTVAIVGSVSYHLHQASTVAAVTLPCRGSLGEWALLVIGCAQGTLHAGQVLCCEACLALAAAGLLALLRQPPHEARRLSGWGALPSAGVLARLALLATATLLLSPLFSTLTRSVSSDTVVACACALLTTHLYLFDYTLSLRPTYELLGSVSTACALCAALLIASRLQSTYQVYAQARPRSPVLVHNA